MVIIPSIKFFIFSHLNIVLQVSLLSLPSLHHFTFDSCTIVHQIEEFGLLILLSLNTFFPHLCGCSVLLYTLTSHMELKLLGQRRRIFICINLLHCLYKGVKLPWAGERKGVKKGLEKHSPLLSKVPVAVFLGRTWLFISFLTSYTVSFRRNS